MIEIRDLPHHNSRSVHSFQSHILVAFLQPHDSPYSRLLQTSRQTRMNIAQMEHWGNNTWQRKSNHQPTFEAVGCSVYRSIVELTLDMRKKQASSLIISFRHAPTISVYESFMISTHTSVSIVRHKKCFNVLVRSKPQKYRNLKFWDPGFCLYGVVKDQLGLLNRKTGQYRYFLHGLWYWCTFTSSFDGGYALQC